MITFPSILEPAARDAGMDVPADPDKFQEEKDKYPHFFCFCVLQLGRPCPYPGVQFDNAKVVMKFSREKLNTATVEDFLEAGFTA